MIRGSDTLSQPSEEERHVHSPIHLKEEGGDWMIRLILRLLIRPLLGVLKASNQTHDESR